MTNVEKLVQAGAVKSADHISAEHQKILNSDFTAEEIDALIKLKDRITGIPFASDPDTGETSGMAAL